MDWSTFLRASATAATLIFGVLGSKHRDDAGRITKGGRIALVGMLSSAALSFGLQFLDARAAGTRRDQEDKRWTTALTQLETNVQGSNTVLWDLRQLASKTKMIQGLVDESLTAQKDVRRKVVDSLDEQQRLASKTREISGAVEQTAQSGRNLTESAEKSMKAQEILYGLQRQVLKQIVRSQYPLEPLTLSYDVTYDMDEPSFSGYARTLQAAHLEAGDRAQVVWSLTGDFPTRGVQHPRGVADLLLRDVSRFVLRDTSRQNGDMTLACMPTAELERYGESTNGRSDAPSQRIDVEADFSHRVFVKKVTCSSPVKGGNDLSSSAIDLIGRYVIDEELRGSEPRSRKLLRMYFKVAHQRQFAPAIEVKNLHPSYGPHIPPGASFLIHPVTLDFTSEDDLSRIGLMNPRQLFQCP